MKRYFEFIGKDAKKGVESSKFWEVWTDDTTLRTRYGKIGSSGQTTLKNFNSISDADKALEKAIAEKTKKGYTESNSLESSEDNDEEETYSRIDANDPEVIMEAEILGQWAKKYIPIALINFELEQQPLGIPNEYIWSQHNGVEYDYMSNGFEPISDLSNPVMSYVITQNPKLDSENYESVTTEINRFCERCQGEGIVDDDDCPDCDGAGTQYFEIPISYPLIISSEEELITFSQTFSGTTEYEEKTPTLSVAKFCAECGAKREPKSAKFCSTCGTAF